MSPDDIFLLSDLKLLNAMSASVNTVRDIVRRSLKLIEQSRIMLRELDIGVASPPTVGESRRCSSRTPRG